MVNKKNYSLLRNSRFYVLVTAFLLSVIVASVIRLQIPSDQLSVIRTQQVFGLISIFYWYTALAISPVGYAVGKNRMIHIEFARRAIGVSAAYFAILHAAIATWGQLGGLDGISTLSPIFKWSLGAGLMGVIVLSLLAATSFDKVISVMTFKRWKWLHRTIYAGGVLAVLHVWSIGTHVEYNFVQVIAFLALVTLSWLEMNRIVILLARKYKSLRDPKARFALFLTLWISLLLLIFMIPKVASYRNDASHSGHSSSHTESHHGH